LAARRDLRRAASTVDLIHAHGLRAGALCAAFVPRVPLIVTWHNAPQGGARQRAAQRTLARYTARSADLTLAASEDLAAAARAAGATDVRSVFVAAPTLGTPRRTRAAVRAELKVGDRPLVLAVGRLHAQKRLDVLVAAAAAWADNETAPMVVIAGEGPARGELLDQIAASGAPVRLLGARDDVADLLAAADVVALPSEWEARALVAQEALRAGVPLIATPVGGLPDLVGRAALEVPVGDAPALRAAVEAVLSNQSQRERMIALGRQRASTWPNDEMIVDDLMQGYLDLDRRMRLR
jgi:glycosyltransferase involved in cell wall biosynthesis